MGDGKNDGVSFEDLSMGDFIESMIRAYNFTRHREGSLVIADGGARRGPLLISRSYHREAVGDLFPFERVTDRHHAIRCFYGYISKYAQTALLEKDFETIARVHEGGPFACKPEKRVYTDAFWGILKKELRRTLLSRPVLVH